MKHHLNQDGVNVLMILENLHKFGRDDIFIFKKQ